MTKLSILFLFIHVKLAFKVTLIKTGYVSTCKISKPQVPYLGKYLGSMLRSITFNPQRIVRLVFALYYYFLALIFEKRKGTLDGKHIMQHRDDAL